MSAVPSYARLVRADNPGPMTLDGTNSWVLDTGDGGVVVDPGPLEDRHLTRLAAYGPVRLVLLTHGHPDHADGCDRLRELVGAPVRALDEAHCRDGAPLADGERLEFGRLTLRALHTPGHSSDSTSFLVEHPDRPAVLTGDTVLGRGTTVVAHPDGRLDDYLASLRLLRALADEYAGLTLLTGHGPARSDAVVTLEGYLAHRAERLAQVRAAIDAGLRTPREVVEAVYADVDRALWPAAELTVRAQLDYLTECDRAR